VRIKTLSKRGKKTYRTDLGRNDEARVCIRLISSPKDTRQVGREEDAITAASSIREGNRGGKKKMKRGMGYSQV